MPPSYSSVGGGWTDARTIWNAYAFSFRSINSSGRVEVRRDWPKPLGPGVATDIGSATAWDTSTWIIGTDPGSFGYGIYRWNGASWQNVAGSAVAIDVGPNGPWIVNSVNEIKNWNGSAFVGLPAAGAAIDIGVGANGSAWIVGTDSTLNGNGVYRWTGSAWQKVPGAATRIDVGPDGNPWIVDRLFRVFRYDGTQFVLVPGIAATDVGVGSDGSVWVVGTNPKPGGYGLFQWKTSQFVPVIGSGLRIAGAGSSKLLVVDNGGQIRVHSYQ